MNDDDDDDNDTAGRQKPVNERVGYLLAVEHDYFGGASAPPPPLLFVRRKSRGITGIIFAPGGLSLSLRSQY